MVAAAVLDPKEAAVTASLVDAMGSCLNGYYATGWLLKWP
jgi:hypothetical protein